MCAFMASGGIGFFSSVSVYNGFGLRNKLRDGPLHNEKARGIFFSPHGELVLPRWACGAVLQHPHDDALDVVSTHL